MSVSSAGRSSASTWKVRLLLTAAALAPAVLTLFGASLFPSAWGAELLPTPDAREYAWMTETLAEEGRSTLPFGDVRLPPRYPWGFPALLSTPVRIFGTVPHSYYQLLIALAALTVLVTAAATLHVARAIRSDESGIGLAAAVLAATLASAFLAAGPLLLRYGVQVMSDIPSTFFAALMVLGAAKVLLRSQGESPSRLALVGLGLAAGYAPTIRITNGALSMAFALVLVWEVARRRVPVSALAWFAIPAALPLAAFGWLQAELYGSPLGTGYAFWLPESFGQASASFSADYLLSPPAEFHWLKTSNLEKYTDLFIGRVWPEDLLFSPILAVLALFGLARAWHRGGAARSFASGLVIGGGTLIGAYLFYKWRDARFVLPLAPLVPPCIALGTVAILKRGIERSLQGRHATLIALALLFTAAAGQHLFGIIRSSVSLDRPPPVHEHLERVAKQIAEGSWIVSDISIPLLDFYVLEPTDHLLPLVMKETTSGLKEQPLALLAAAEHGRAHLPTIVECADGAITDAGRAGLDALAQAVMGGAPAVLLQVTPGNAGRRAHQQAMQALERGLAKRGLRVEPVEGELPLMKFSRIVRQ